MLKNSILCIVRNRITTYQIKNQLLKNKVNFTLIAAIKLDMCCIQ